MLKIIIPETEVWDEVREQFISTKEQTLSLEHSLVSLSRWESKWEKPFLKKEDRSFEENIDYIRCMTINGNVDPNAYYCLTPDNIAEINKYIESPMTATTIPDNNQRRGPKEQITSELIYYWMIAFNIPFECEKWHLNRLLTLIRVCDFKNKPPKKMSTKEIMSRNAALNQARRAKLNSRG